jgi:hypothetical protein
MGAINPHYDIRYVEHVDPHAIWRWWFTEHEPGFIEKQNRDYDNLFDRLEKSILKEGFKNPLILTCGGGNASDIFRMIHENIEKDPVKAETFERFKTKEDLLSTQLFATREGDARIYTARKLNISVRSVILDYSSCYSSHREITSLSEFMDLFDPVYAENVKDVCFTDTSIDLELDPWVKMYFKPYEDPEDAETILQQDLKSSRPRRLFDMLKRPGW